MSFAPGSLVTESRRVRGAAPRRVYRVLRASGDRPGWVWLERWDHCRRRWGKTEALEVSELEVAPGYWPHTRSAERAR